MPFAIINRVALQENQEYNNKLPNCVSGTTKRLVALQIQVDDYRKSDRKMLLILCDKTYCVDIFSGLITRV